MIILSDVNYICRNQEFVGDPHLKTWKSTFDVVDLGD
jgi:hypothetical protein